MRVYAFDYTGYGGVVPDVGRAPATKTLCRPKEDEGTSSYFEYFHLFSVCDFETFFKLRVCAI